MNSVNFSLFANTNIGDNAYVAGSWNQWAPVALQYDIDSSCWTGKIQTSLPTIQYKYVISDAWESGENRKRVISQQCSPDYWRDDNFKYIPSVGPPSPPF
ncbi:hypothetical protein GEMRC1_006815 [Eukaryota sp. GEM-RC1]